MDLNQLVQVLGACISPDTNVRKQAEEHLNAHQHSPMQLVNLLQATVSVQLDVSVRQVAAIQFKNQVARDWDPPTNTPCKFSDQDKHTVRENIIEGIIQAPPLVRVQLGECLKTIVYCDYPQNWPNLLQIIMQNVTSPEQNRIYGAMFVLRVLTRKYEFKDREERKPVVEIINATFPILLQAFQHFLNIPADQATIEVADLVKLICKTFWSSTYVVIPPILLEPQTFLAWMSCFLQLINRHLPEEMQPADKDQRKAWPWWKCKKWCLHIMNRIFSRYGDPKACKGHDQQFAELFKKECSIKFLEAYVNLLGILRQGGYLPDRVINLALQYVTSAVSRGGTYKLVKPHMDVILYEIVFPLMCFNDDDAELWNEDPHEYVRKGYDIIEDMYSPRTAASSLMGELIRIRGKENLPKLVMFLVNVFNGYNAAPPDQKPVRQKDGALLAIGSLHEKLRSTDPYKGELETMLMQHVLPEFQSPYGHLRAKATWVAGQYADIDFANQQNFTVLLHHIFNALKDPELPVRMDAVVGLRSFVDASHDLNEIRPILPHLLDEFFKLLNEVENEDLVFTLETIVDKFGEEIAPYAVGLCQNLAMAFWKCMQSDDDEDEDDMGALAAVGCLRAVSTILESVSSLPDLFPQLEKIMLPVMERMLTSDGQDVYEEVLEIVSYFTYFSAQISLDMWKLWPIMCKAMDEWALDYFENVLVPMDNYVAKGTDHFVGCKDPSYLQMTYHICQKVLADSKIPDCDVIPAPKLMESVLQNCRGRVDEWVDPYVTLCMQRLGVGGGEKPERLFLRDLLIQVVANALYYNAGLALQVLSARGLVGPVFQEWFTMITATGRKPGSKAPHFKREHDKKVNILGLVSLLSVPPQSLPAELQAGYPQLVAGVVKMLTDLKALLEKQKQELEAESDGDEDGSEGAGRGMFGGMLGGGGEGDEEDSGDEDEEVDGDMLLRMAGRAREFRLMDDDDLSDGEWTDDEEFTSPIDDVDAFVFFRNSMRTIQESDPQRFGFIMGALDQGGQLQFEALAAHATVREQEIAKEKEEEAREEAEKIARKGQVVGRLQ